MSRSRLSAFTLIEMIIVVALIGIIGSLIVVNVDGLLRGLGDKPIDEAFRQAVREGRYQAAAQKNPTSITFDQKETLFRLFDFTGGEIETFPFTGYEDATRVDVIFYQILPLEGLNSSSRNEVSEVDRIQFRPDRSSTPFEVEFRLDTEQWKQTYDPFSDIILKDSRTQ